MEKQIFLLFAPLFKPIKQRPNIFDFSRAFKKHYNEGASPPPLVPIIKKLNAQIGLNKTKF
jgi:hypothetical protein